MPASLPETADARPAADSPATWVLMLLAVGAAMRMACREEAAFQST